MVYRVYVEKKKPFAVEARALCADLRGFLGIAGLETVRIFNRYDVEDIERSAFGRAVKNVLSEPQVDDVFDILPETGGELLAVEYLPGQYDQRADSAAQCIQVLTCAPRPAVRTAKVYALCGKLKAEDIGAIKKYLINPVDSREASLEKPETLKMPYPEPERVKTLEGFREIPNGQLGGFIARFGLAMDEGDLALCRNHFALEGRDPTMTEIRVIDTYWSDHCRHTTFNTVLENVSFESPELASAWQDYLDIRSLLGRTKPVTLMDVGTIAAKHLRAQGLLDGLDESEEINACTVKIKVTMNGRPEDWLLLFKNETHNHPTEIEPFGGAATCIGGAIRDPLSGRSYVYAAMRVTGAADPLRPAEETLPGKLPQRKIVTAAAAGYSSYGNQIGLATGQVDEIYHPGYMAKRMEVGAVIAAAPADNVRRERPAAGDCVLLIGGRTGRDGCGGATGSSKAHTAHSLEQCGAEVQKGNAPEERKLQRLFRSPECSQLIKRCNDFGAGGVAVAVGELADGLNIDLDAVPKKYEGLDGTELAISESQERMAVVVAAEDEERFCNLASRENLECTRIAIVTAEPRLRMRWRGETIVDLPRTFLDTNGSPKSANAHAAAPQNFEKPIPGSFSAGMAALAGDLNVCSRRGLSERFDSTIGAGAVLMPFGGTRQLTPAQAMVTKISAEQAETDDCSVMAWGYNPYIAEKSPFHAAYLAVVESVCRLAAAGAEIKDVYLSFQEYFERLGTNSERWGKPLAALLGALKAQLGLKIAAIGGKDSMSGSFEDLDVPPTLISFAVTTAKTDDIVSGEFKRAGHRVVLIRPEYDSAGLPTAESLLRSFELLHSLTKSGAAASVYTPGFGGIAESVMKMCFGNGLGFRFAPEIRLRDIFSYAYGSFVAELTGGERIGIPLGETTADGKICLGTECLELDGLLRIYEDKLEPVYPSRTQTQETEVPAFGFAAKCRTVGIMKAARPRVLIPVFPGTNCEYDSARAFAGAGAEPEVVVIRSLTPQDIAESVEHFAKRAAQSQIIFIPGGFSGGDEPDGSGKLITSFFRSGAVKDAVNELLSARLGLMAGICNGFQALIKLGLVPYGEIIDTDENCPTLTCNAIGRHQSRIVRTRVASNKSPWLALTQPGEIYSVPVSHGEGRFTAPDGLVRRLAENGQIATQYVDAEGKPTMDIRFNPNGSAFAVEGITSPDGRVLGKMGHSERAGKGLYRNVEGDYNIMIFTSAVKYFE